MIVCMPHCGAAANSTSGGEVFERELLAHLPEQGIEPHVYGPAFVGLRWWNARYQFRRSIRRCMRDHRPSLMRVHSLRYTAPAAYEVYEDIPITVHFHHLEPDRLAWLDLVILEQADQITTDSWFSWSQLPFPLQQRCEVIPPGVDHKRFYPVQPSPVMICLLMGGPKKRKNARFVHELWPEVEKRIPNVQLVELGLGQTDEQV